MFGDFQVYQGIDSIRWYNDGSNNGIFTIYAIIALGLYGLFWICPLYLCLWQRQHVKVPRATAARELDKVEADWKKKWLEAARDWKPPSDDKTPERCEPMLPAVGDLANAS